MGRPLINHGLMKSVIVKEMLMKRSDISPGLNRGSQKCLLHDQIEVFSKETGSILIVIQVEL
jgi:hypothetical protein